MVTKKKIGVLMLFSVVIVVIMMTEVLATTATIGNARMILYPQLENGKAVIQKSIMVNNTNSFPVNITLEASDNYKDIITIQDANFILQSGEKRDARFTITVTKAGDYEGKVLVYFTPLNDSHGVALASNIIMYVNGTSSDEGGFFGDGVSVIGNVLGNDGGVNWIVILFGITSLILVIILIFLFYVSRKKRGGISSEFREGSVGEVKNPEIKALEKDSEKKSEKKIRRVKIKDE